MATGLSSYIVWLIAFLIAVVPRVIRLLYWEAYFEDSVYLYHAFAINIGRRPFIDMICTHPPTIENLLSILYNIFGVSYRVAEIFTALIMVAASFLSSISARD